MSGICIALAVLCVVLAASLGSTVSQIRKERKRFNSLNQQYHAFYQRFKNIIDIEEAHAHLSKLFNMERARAKSTMLDLKHKHDQMLKAHEVNKAKLHDETERIVHTIESLQKELDELTEHRHLQVFGFYKTRYEFDAADGYKRKLDEIRKMQQSLLIDHKAAICHTESPLLGSNKDGKKMVTDTMKLVLRAFNGECDAAVARVDARNVITMERRINKAFEDLNMLARFKHIEITHEYLRLKLNELYLTHEFHLKLEDEKEEQRKLREQIREEESIKRELSRAALEAENEENRLTERLAQAHKLSEDASDEELASMLNEIENLQQKLDTAQQRKKQAEARLGKLTAGHVFILSNIGAFGENMYKVGMTRSPNPDEYIKQLGDEAVPFHFDVHALIYSDNAEALVNELHQAFAPKRVNLVNMKSDFYQISLHEIERIVRMYDADAEIFQASEAGEYNRSMAMQQEETPKDRPPAPKNVDVPNTLLEVANN